MKGRTTAGLARTGKKAEKNPIGCSQPYASCPNGVCPYNFFRWGEQGLRILPVGRSYFVATSIMPCKRAGHNLRS